MLHDYGRKCKKSRQGAADSAQWYDSRMIGYIEGTVKAARDAHLIVLTGGVGYKVGVLKETVLRTAVGSPVSLWIYTAVREDAFDLYGFAHEEELRFFELLLTVSGIGPKSALGILDIASVETLRRALAFCISAISLGTKPFSAAVVADCKVNWYCALLMVESMVRSCTGCR